MVFFIAKISNRYQASWQIGNKVTQRRSFRVKGVFTLSDDKSQPPQASCPASQLPPRQQDCRPPSVKWIHKASQVSSHIRRGGGRDGEGPQGPEDLCTTSWHHTRNFFPFLNLSSLTPTSPDSCDTTRGNLSHFTAVTKGFLAQLPERRRLMLRRHTRNFKT